MTQYAEEEVARQVEFARIVVDRFGHGLVDGFVEARQVLERFLVHLGLGGAPQLDDAGAQGAVFRNHLIHIEAAVVAERRMGFGGAGVGGPWFVTMGFGDLLPGGLGGGDIFFDKSQDLDDVIAQGERAHMFGGRHESLGEVFPLLDDRGRVITNEIGNGHQGYLSIGEYFETPPRLMNACKRPSKYLRTAGIAARIFRH